MPHNPNPIITILLADDHAVVRDGIAMRLSREPNIKLVGEACNGQQAVDQALALRPNIVLMDISMPLMNGLQATERLRATNSPVKVLILTMHDEKEYVVGIMNAGAQGYLLKDITAKEMIQGIKQVHGGSDFYCSGALKILSDTSKGKQPFRQPIGLLSKREKEVLSLVAEGHGSKTIADLLYLSIRTVETHRRNIMKKLDIHSSAALVKYSLENKII